MIAVYVLIALLLLLLNAFFVLAEFGAVKMRPTRVEELARSGDPRAALLRHIQGHLDEYLSVCQVGITLASIGLGFVGEPAFARLLEPCFAWAGIDSPILVHSVAVTVAYLAVAYLHIVVGELVPKSMAIRGTEQAALFAARPLRFFHFLFYLPLVVLNGSANLCVRLLGYPPRPDREKHSEQEIKIILAGSHSLGLLSFRRLLLIENILDVGDLKVRDIMRPKGRVKILRPSMSWESVAEAMMESRYSRYPVVDLEDRVVGILHVKDLLYSLLLGRPPADWTQAAKGALAVSGELPLERLLTDLQRQRKQAAVVTEGDVWVGFITMEDVLESVVGTIEDEFEVEPRLFLGDILTLGRILPELETGSLREAIGDAVMKVRSSELPVPPEAVVRRVLDREAVMSTYLGNGVALPHARLERLARSVLIVARSKKGIPVEQREERAHLIFLLLTPADAPREQVRLVARIARLLESEYVAERLKGAETPQEILELIREGDASN